MKGLTRWFRLVGGLYTLLGIGFLPALNAIRRPHLHRLYRSSLDRDRRWHPRFTPSQVRPSENPRVPGRCLAIGDPANQGPIKKERIQ